MPKPQSNRCWGQGLWLLWRKKYITLGVTAAPPSLQRFFINNRFPMAVKGVGHIHNCYPALCPSFLRREKWFSIFSTFIFGISFFLFPFCSILTLCPHFFSFSSSSQEVQLKSIRSPFFFCWEWSWNGKWATSSDTSWTHHLSFHGMPGDHLKPEAFIRKSQGLFRWCKALPGARTWWRTE